MRILRIIPTLNPAYGGPVAGLKMTAKGLLDRGVLTEVLTLDPPGAPCLTSCDFPATGVGPGFLKAGFTPRIGQWIAQHGHRFDGAIVHGIWSHASVAGAAALARMRLPYVLYTHGMMDPWFREAKPVKHWVKQAFWLAQGRALASAHAVLFTAELERDLARGVFWGPSYHDRVVRYGTERPKCDASGVAAFRAAVPSLGARPYILFLSRIHAKKGCDLLLRAHRSLPDLPDIVLAGPDPNGLIPDLLASGATGRVHYAGPLYDAAKGAALSGAEAFALISHQENFGIVLAEAMALGTPVLTTDKVNIWPIIEQNEAGLIGPDSQSGAICLLERFFKMSVSERMAMRDAARRTYDAHFAPDGAVDDLYAVLTEMTGEQRCAA